MNIKFTFIKGAHNFSEEYLCMSFFNHIHFLKVSLHFLKKPFKGNYKGDRLKNSSQNNEHFYDCLVHILNNILRHHCV